jgi:hypothetical protein
MNTKYLMNSQGRNQTQLLKDRLIETVTLKRTHLPTIRDYAEFMRCFGPDSRFDDRLCRRIVEKLAGRIRGTSALFNETGAERAQMRFILATGIRSALQGIIDAYRAGNSTASVAFEFPRKYTAVIGEKIPIKQLGTPEQKGRPRSFQVWIECQTVEEMIADQFLDALRGESADHLASQLRPCEWCHQLFFGRSQKRTCSPRCRTARHRANNPEKKQEYQNRAELARSARESVQGKAARANDVRKKQKEEHGRKRR